jgi:hypothetical protein
MSINRSIDSPSICLSPVAFQDSSTDVNGCTPSLFVQAARAQAWWRHLVPSAFECQETILSDANRRAVIGWTNDCEHRHQGDKVNLDGEMKQVGARTSAPA